MFRRSVAVLQQIRAWNGLAYWLDQDGQTTARGPDTAPWNVLSGPRDIIPNLTNKKEYIPVRTKLW